MKINKPDQQISNFHPEEIIPVEFFRPLEITVF